MFHLSPQPSFYKPPSNPYSIDLDPDMPNPSSSNLYDLELQTKFGTCRKNLLIFLRNINGKGELMVNFKVIKRYYKMPFDEFPEIQEIMKIFEKITQRISINKSQQKNWYLEDIMLLTWLVVKYSYFKLTDVKFLADAEWSVIAEIIPFKTGEQCKFKWLSLERLNLQEKPWSVEEDQILKELVIENPNKKWTEIAKILYLKSGEVVYRAGKFCRERWNNYLTPDLKKGIWLSKEDIDLLEKVIRIGKKWSEISRITPGRTENGVKNRFNSLMKKWLKKHSYSLSTEEEVIVSELYKSLIDCQSKTEAESRKNELEMAISRNQTLSKRVFHIEELRKKQEFNLLFELLKSDIGNSNVQDNEKIKLCGSMKRDPNMIDRLPEKKIHVEIPLKTEDKEKEPVTNCPNAGAGMGGMFPSSIFNMNTWMMQQQMMMMMNMMMTQNLTRNMMMNGLIKQE